MYKWTAEPMAVQGPRKGESSNDSMRYGFRTQPARLVRGSSRRIMSLRFRPAYISVINRRASAEAVISLLSKKNQGERNLRFLSPLESPFFPQRGSKLTSGNVFPPCRPSKLRWMPERCSTSRFRCSAPFRRDGDCDGRLQREHFTDTRKNKRPKTKPLKSRGT